MDAKVAAHDMKERILVVEDEVDLRELIGYALTQGGYEVTLASNGQAALAELARFRPNLVMLDLMLPDMSGADICRRIRQNEHTRSLPVIMVTARTEEIDRVVGFEIGADDYVVKPFSPRELVLRVGAVLRRAQTPVPIPSSGTHEPKIVIGPMQIDPERHLVTVEGQPIILTALEFKLLIDLVERKGRVQSRDALLERVWDYASGVETRTVDTHVKRLREKLGEARDCIETVRGVGYRARDLE